MSKKKIRFLDRAKAIVAPGRANGSLEIDAAKVDALISIGESLQALVEHARIANLIALTGLAGNTHIQESDFDEGATLAHEGLHALIDYERTEATQISDAEDYPVIRADIAKALGLS